MQKKVQFTGIVLRNLDYLDSAQIIYVLTKDNIESILVRGAKKIESKTRPLSQIITKISGLRTESKTFSTLTEGVVLNNYNEIKEDFIKTQAVMCILEKVYNLYPNISNTEILYNFLEDVLGMIEKTKYPKSLLLLFEVKLWYLLGINPNFTSCVECGNHLENGVLNVNCGGFLCQNCSTLFDVDLNVNESTILKYLYYIKMEKIDEHFLELVEPFYNQITHIVDKYYTKHLDFYNKSKEVFYKVI
ncbi:MAG: DNA repair protein RecO [Bacilli bacterium]|nr:DNA repair protein RecO [Bacilli bacterium]